MSKKSPKDEKELEKYATGGQIAGGALGSALSGAGAGAALGSVVPGIGTAIGAIGGALVGGIGSLLGNSGSAPVTNPALSPDQLAGANSAVSHAAGNQQQLVNALGQVGGIQNQQQVYGQQQALASQLQAMSQGAGPNPALAQLNQTTGQNVANQAALMAGQRGAGANAGLIARQAAQQGAATQQQAVGQVASLRAQQQLAAIGALQQQQGMLGGLANQQVSNQMQAQSNLNSLDLAQQQNLLNANQGANAQAINQSQFNQQQTNQYLGAGLNAAGSVLGSGILGGKAPTNTSVAAAPIASGEPSLGAVPSAAPGSNVFGVSNGVFAQGGEVQPQIGSNAMLKENYSGPRSSLGKRLKAYANGGEVKALVSPGEIYLPPAKADKVMSGKANPLDGEKIPGKPAVGGAKNSYANDTVEKTLKAGGIVLPRSVTQSSNPSEAAKKFVEALKAKKSRK